MIFRDILHDDRSYLSHKIKFNSVFKLTVFCQRKMQNQEHFLLARIYDFCFIKIFQIWPTRMNFGTFLNLKKVVHSIRETSIQLTSLYYQFYNNFFSYWNIFFLFYKTTYLNGEVNHTESSPSARVPWCN